MIDFQNAIFAKLKPTDNAEYAEIISPILTEGEVIHQTFRSYRDGVIFTNKRIIAVNVQGITGKKKDFTSLPYSKIQAFSIETAGVLDLDSELQLWFSGLGKVHLEFSTKADVQSICRMIAENTL